MKSKFSVYHSAKNFYAAQPVTLHAYETIGSTNTVAKDETLKTMTELPHVYLALEQQQGRGRGDHTWLQSHTGGQQLFITWSFLLPSPPQAITAPLAGLMIYECLTKIWPTQPLCRWGIKPPNDIYLENKKIGGLLIETVSQGPALSRLIIGLGLNVFGHPATVPEASHMTFFIEVSQPNFLLFLTEIESRWGAFLKRCQNPILSKDNKSQLLAALNSCQINPQTILEVTDHCDLVTATATVSWRTL